MKHWVSSEFWDLYEKLPINVRTLADKNYALLKEDPKHPSLHFTSVGKFWSVLVGIRYRALAIEIDEGFLWFWIGSHSQYDKLTK